ncbi:MAG: ADP-glyceromanno-heptose 6-epimerase [Nitrospirae bacterium]|nr:MAG: ADP-glyceromanno-heptose 6-epimerase [Nitrospirota bacterium]
MKPLHPILVTGAAGFIGSRFVASCNEQGWPVVSVDELASFGTRPEMAGIDFGSRVSLHELRSWLQTEQPALKAVVHLGACTDTTEMNEAYLKSVNLDYSQHLWTYCVQQRLPLVYASSAATYGDGSLGYDDDETLIPRLKPLNPYGQSKQDFDCWALDQERRGSSPPAWSAFKFFNVYGFGERHKDKMASVVLHAFDQVRTKGKVRLFKSHKAGIADGEQKRDFIYVRDVVDVLRFALEKPLARGIFNLGTGQARTFLDLVRCVFRELGRPEAIEFIDTPIEIRERYQYFTEAKMGRLRAAGYTAPFTSLEEGVRLYVRGLLAQAART